MTLMQRRRALMALKKGGGGVPAGYVTDGLVFFLDGKQLVNSNTWTDIVGGKTFVLTDCTVSGGGVAFNGSSSNGLIDGHITENVTGETIEVCVVRASTERANPVLIQPYLNSVIGVSLILSAGGKENIYIDGGLRAMRDCGSTAKTLSVSMDRCVANKVNKTSTHSMSNDANLVDKTILGARSYGSVMNLSSFFSGTIYAIRIYNRKLSQEEMMQNQQADIDRYGITI